MNRWLVLLALLAPWPVLAADWSFDRPIEVSRVHKAKIFHHLESAGRKGIAISGKNLAVTWEDNRSGIPQCYVAVKSTNGKRFDAEYKVSGKNEAFEPTIVGLSKGRFAVAWEEGNAVWARLIDAKGAHRPVQLTKGSAAQITLGFSAEGGLFAAWAEKRGNFTGIVFAQLLPDEKRLLLKLGTPGFVEKENPTGDQLYPTLAVNSDSSLVLGWEDRRAGHTVIMAGRVEGGKVVSVKQINELSAGNTMGLGRGSGAMRVAMTSYGEAIAATWSDKRDFLSGYDVYVALSHDKGRNFGVNQKVQDGFGDNIAQWHPAIAGNAAGQLVVAFDDDRNGEADVWISWPTAQGWSDNLALPGGSGPGLQSEPVVTLDEKGNLHAAWIQKPNSSAPSRVMYTKGVSGGK